MPARPIGVILLQLGTPDAPTAAALRPYLREFLSDPRVIDLPRAFWLPILYGSVLVSRPKQSAKLYKKVWTAEGSPLAVITEAQARGLERRLNDSTQTPVRVVVGMRYGQPSVASALEALAKEGIDRILAFPMYPQYASATTGTSLEQLFDLVGRPRVVPSIRVVPPYYDDTAYIGALAATARESLATWPERPDVLLMSFHGVPKRYITLGDPYRSQCAATHEALTHELRAGDVSPASIDHRLVFQSQFGKEEWLQPYTDKVLEELGRAGAKVAVMSPGFTADCLETLEEIRIRGEEQFREAGGRHYHAIPCLNEHPAWMDAMAAIASRELAGWR